LGSFSNKTWDYPSLVLLFSFDRKKKTILAAKISFKMEGNSQNKNVLLRFYRIFPFISFVSYFLVFIMTS